MDVLKRDGVEGPPDGVAVVTTVEVKIMESLYDVAMKGGGELIGYARFTGRAHYNESDEAPEDLVGSVGSRLNSWRLSARVVNDDHWAVFQRRRIVWNDVSPLPPWDIRLAATVALRGAEIWDTVGPFWPKQICIENGQHRCRSNT